VDRGKKRKARLGESSQRGGRLKGTKKKTKKPPTKKKKKKRLNTHTKKKLTKIMKRKHLRISISRDTAQ